MEAIYFFRKLIHPVRVKNETKIMDAIYFLEN